MKIILEIFIFEIILKPSQRLCTSSLGFGELFPIPGYIIRRVICLYMGTWIFAHFKSSTIMRFTSISLTKIWKFVQSCLIRRVFLLTLEHGFCKLSPRSTIWGVTSISSNDDVSIWVKNSCVGPKHSQKTNKQANFHEFCPLCYLL